jgi:hypothetical protein
MITELSVFLPNEPGMLAELIKKLYENSIIIRAISVVETADYGLILLLVNKPTECIVFLEENEYEFTKSSVLAVKFLGEQPMGLFNIAKILGDNNVNIEYLYLTVVERTPLIVIRVDDLAKGQRVLQENNFNLMEEDQL